MKVNKKHQLNFSSSHFLSCVLHSPAIKKGISHNPYNCPKIKGDGVSGGRGKCVESKEQKKSQKTTLDLDSHEIIIPNSSNSLESMPKNTLITLLCTLIMPKCI